MQTSQKKGGRVEVWVGGRVFYSIREAAAWLGVLPKTVGKALKEGRHVKGWNVYRVADIKARANMGGKRGS